MKNLPLTFVVLMASALGGCASGSLGKLVTPNTVLIAQIAIDTAVGAVIGPDTAAGQAKALAIKTVASQLLAIDTGSSVPIVALTAALNAKVASLKLNPAETLAAQNLLQIIPQVTANLISKPTTSTSTTPNSAATAQVAIATVLQQIINATAAYGV